MSPQHDAPPRLRLPLPSRERRYACDFNQQLGLQWRNGKPIFLWDIEPAALEGREIWTGEHCFGCTAGGGSSCGGALIEPTGAVH